MIYPESYEIENSIKTMRSVSSPDVMRHISSSRLRTCFEDIVKRIKVVFNLNTLEYILIDLKINMKQLDATLQQIIPYMLISYIKSWPGWSESKEYENGFLKIDEYYGKFLNYVIFKLNYLIDKGYQKALTELKNESESQDINSCLQSCVETQCLSENLDSNAEDPPKLLNTLIFRNQQDNIVITVHAINNGHKQWTSKLSKDSLVNWPFIEIQFTSPFIKFSRKVVPKYVRYMPRADNITVFPKQDFIPNFGINTDYSRNCYSRQFLMNYLSAYSTFLKSKNFGRDKMKEIIEIFSQLLRDIEELGTVCENGIFDSTAISFNIGGCRYLRTKKIVRVSNSHNPDAPIVDYSEVLTPKCSLHFFKNEYAEQAQIVDGKRKITLLRFFNYIEKKLLDGKSRYDKDTLPSIMYSCSYCNKEYRGIFAQKAILHHIHNDHSMEHELICPECKARFNAFMLVKTRWFHRCESNPTA